MALVENGLASVHFTAERSSHYNALCRAEEQAKAAKKNVSVFGDCDKHFKRGIGEVQVAL